VEDLTGVSRVSSSPKVDVHCVLCTFRALYPSYVQPPRRDGRYHFDLADLEILNPGEGPALHWGSGPHQPLAY
jgi:hypothetical protein